MKRVLVSGCYDLLHAGHIFFFETAAKFGDLYVCIGSDANIRMLKSAAPRFTEQERLYMVQSCRFVHQARISSGSGMLDFEPDIDEVKPGIFIVNHDGDTPDKRELCKRKGVEYVALPRVPREGLPVRSSTAVKRELQPPYRLCLAGGWMDQPFVSILHPGSVVVVQIHPERPFNLRSGLATSTRNLWTTIFRYGILEDQPEDLAKLLFGYENPPGTKYVAGSQDAIGLTHAGVNRLYYDGEYWPKRIDKCVDDDICAWLENSIRLVELFERPPGYDPLAQQNLTVDGAKRLGQAGQDCWNAILRKDIKGFGRALTDTHRAWAELLPLTTSPEIEHALDRYECHGRITTGCGGGYAILATDKDVPEGFRVKVKR